MESGEAPLIRKSLTTGMGSASRGSWPVRVRGAARAKDRMKTILVEGPEAEAFAAALKERFSDREILTGRPRSGVETPYLVTGTPPPGFIGTLLGLRMVLSLNAGVDRLLEQEPLPPDVLIVKMADEGLKSGMTEWVLAQVLSWHRSLWEYEGLQRKGIWEPRPERLARERRVAVLGAGALALPAGAALAALGFQVGFYGQVAGIRDGLPVVSGPEGLRRLLEGADVLVDLLPLTAATRGFVDRAVLSLLAPGALFLNAGRGATVSTEALLEALGEGRLSWAVLDVFEEEPLARDHPFWRHPKVRITPHVAAVTRPDTAATAVAERILAFERGERPPHLVQPGRGY